MKKVAGFFESIWDFYYQGLRNMTSFGKNLWKILGFKAVVVVIFVFFLFPNMLKTLPTDQDRIDYVKDNILDFSGTLQTATGTEVPHEEYAP